MLYQITVTEHDGGVTTRIRCTTPTSAQVLRAKLQRELGSQVAITGPETVGDIVTRTVDEGDRARSFVAMVM